MKNEYLTTEIRESIGIITLNYSQTLNSINEKMMSELVEQLQEYEQNEQVKVIVLKGIEKSFAAGLDIKELANDLNDAKTSVRHMQKDFNSLLRIQKPIIAVVSGFALGAGCEIVLACDIVIAADNAKFGLPELSLGLLPCFGGCGLLAARIGKAKAMDIVLSGKAMSADEAEQAGLVSRVVTPEALDEEYLKLARRIASFSQDAVLAAKKVICEQSAPSHLFFENLFSLNRIESEEFRQILQTYAAKKPSEAENA